MDGPDRVSKLPENCLGIGKARGVIAGLWPANPLGWEMLAIAKAGEGACGYELVAPRVPGNSCVFCGCGVDGVENSSGLFKIEGGTGICRSKWSYRNVVAVWTPGNGDGGLLKVSLLRLPGGVEAASGV